MLDLRFRATWVLILAAGSLTCSADSTGVTEEPTAIEVLAGHGQQGVVGEALPDSIVVRLVDSKERPVSDHSIAFRLVTGTEGAGVNPASAVTDADGRAAVSGRLGILVAPWEMEASAGGVTVRVSASAVAAAPDSMLVVRGQNQNGRAGDVLDDSLVVEVIDRFGNPTPGADVTWQPGGAGTVSAGLVTTGSDGLAGVQRQLGPTAGHQFTTAVVEGIGGSPLAFNHVALATYVSTEPNGVWSGVESWPVVAVHLHLLPNGRVMAWGKSGDPQVWDPGTASFTAIPSPAWVFCGGHAFLPDGRLLVTGGHIDDGVGLADVSIYDFQSGTWSQGPSMEWGRWYPTSTTLPNGEVLTLAGSSAQGVDVETPEVWLVGGGWRKLTGAVEAFPLYPRLFVAPDGRVFYAGPERHSRYLNTNGNGSWSATVATTNEGSRSHGGTVMYEAGKILIVGGSLTGDLLSPTNSAEVIDLNHSSPEWRLVGSMQYPRLDHNTTILPTGDVLVTGGTSIGPNEAAGAVRAAEVWSRLTESWTTLASNSVNRMYHSTSILLPDGRVLHAGSGEGKQAASEFSAELFSPPYLFQGPRPVITSAPASVGYDQTFTVSTPDAIATAKVTLVRLGSATHAFDQNQRLNQLSFSKTATGISVRAPANGNLAPPGHYMLFLVNYDGVPSVASIIRIM
jgi:galactose oxidase-like protein/Kelch motif protein